MPRNLLRGVIVPQTPHFAVLVVTIQIDVAQLGELGSLGDVAAGDGAALGVVMLDDGRHERSGAALAVGVEGVGTFHDAPAMIASAIDEFDHLPEVLTDVPDPGLASM